MIQALSTLELIIVILHLFLLQIFEENFILISFEMEECMPIYTNSAGSILEKFKGNEILLNCITSCGKLARNNAQIKII